eukprot:262644_1
MSNTFNLNVISALIAIFVSLFHNVMSYTIYVDTTNQRSLNEQNGSSWSYAFSSLTSALQQIQDNDTIFIRKGTYYPTTTTNRDISFTIDNRNSIKIYGGFNGDETTLNQRINDSILTILSGNINDVLKKEDNSYHVLKIANCYQCIISDLVIVDGYNIDLGGANQLFNDALAGIERDIGAGIFVSNSENIYIVNTILYENSGGYGSGIFVGASHNVSIINVTAKHNHATEHGAGIKIEYSNTIKIVFTVFANNSNGGLFLQNCDSIYIADSHFVQNTGNAFEIISSNNIILISATLNKNTGAGFRLGVAINVNVIDTVIEENNGAGWILVSVQKLNVLNTTVNRNTGTGISLTNCANINISNINLNANKGFHGGAIFISTSNDINVVDTMINNNSAQSGGAIYVDGDKSWSKNIIFLDTMIYNNNAANGGGIYTLEGNDIHIINCEFDNNNAVYSGGGIHMQSLQVYRQTRITITKSLFRNNIAGDYGGAIQSDSLYQIKVIQTIIQDNVAGFGGGISVQGTRKIDLSEVGWFHNSATRGGAIYHSPSFATASHSPSYSAYGVLIFNNSFANNSALQGAAMQIIQSEIPVLCDIYTSSFYRNNALSGGALSVFDDKQTSSNNYNSEIRIDNSNFYGNSATIGGSLYIFSDCLAIHINESNFQYNTADKGGGIMISIQCNVNVIFTNTIFSNNLATSSNGSALALLQGKNVTLNGCIFTFNNCSQNGGAIYMSDAENHLFLNNCTFNKNNAKYYGAALFIDNSGYQSTVDIVSSTFYDNVALDGGALYLGGGMCFILSSIFDHNYAQEKGGCIATREPTSVMLSDTNLTHCSSNNVGGALYSETHDISMDGVLFDSCYAANGGAVYFTFCPAENNTNLRFNENSAEFGGAATMSDNQCDLEWCGDCTYTDNKSPYGSILASLLPSVLNIESDIPDTVHQRVPFNINVSVVDEYNQEMKQTNYLINITTHINDSRVWLNSLCEQSTTNYSYNESISNGYTTFQLCMQPATSIKYEEILLNMKFYIVVSSPLNTTTKIFYTQFENKIYHTSSYIYVLSFIMSSIILIITMIITNALLKHKNHKIIQGGIPLYLYTILLGTFLLSTVIVLVHYVWSCKLMVVLLHLSFILIVGPISAKIMYIWFISFFKQQYVDSYKKMNLNVWSFYFLVCPLISISIYFIVWILEYSEWNKWKIDEVTGVNVQFCQPNRSFMLISSTCCIMILLWLIQVSLNITDKINEHNTKTIVIITLFYVIIMIFVIFNLTSHDMTKEFVSFGCFLLILFIDGYIYGTQFYQIWMQNITDAKYHSIQSVEMSEMTNVVYSNTDGEAKEQQKENNVFHIENYDHQQYLQTNPELLINDTHIAIDGILQNKNNITTEWDLYHLTYESRNHLSIRGRRKCLNKEHCHSLNNIKLIMKFYINWLHFQVLHAYDKIAVDIHLMNNTQTAQLLADLYLHMTSVNENNNIYQTIKQNGIINGKTLINLKSVNEFAYIMKQPAADLNKMFEKILYAQDENKAFTFYDKYTVSIDELVEMCDNYSHVKLLNDWQHTYISFNDMNVWDEFINCKFGGDCISKQIHLNREAPNRNMFYPFLNLNAHKDRFNAQVILINKLNSIHYYLYHATKQTQNENDENEQKEVVLPVSINSSKFTTDINQQSITTNYSFGLGFRYGVKNKNHKYYICPKYESLKDEVINNDLAKISLFNWDTINLSAQKHLESNICREMKARPYRGLNNIYNIAVNSIVSLRHLLSLLLYTNNTEFQRKMKQTMRKLDENKSLQNVMDKNSNFAHFCGFLYEVTSFFSELTEDDTFYHGINCQLLFDKFHCNFSMPVSTTINKEIARNFCSIKGILLTMHSMNSSNSIYTLPLEWISAYPQEQERLFFESTLAIANLYIINLSFQSNKNNKKYVKIISLYDSITNGAFLSTFKMKSNRNEKLKDILLTKISGKPTNTNNLYISQLFDNYYLKNKFIWINFNEIEYLNCENKQQEQDECKMSLKTLFVDDRKGTAKFGKWIKYLQNEIGVKILPLHLFECFFSSYKMQQLFNNQYKQCVVSGNNLCCELNYVHSNNVILNVAFSPYLQSWDGNKFAFGLKVIHLTNPISSIKMRYNVNIQSIRYYEHFSPMFMSINPESGGLNQYEAAHLSFNQHEINNIIKNGFNTKFAIMISQ